VQGRKQNLKVTSWIGGKLTQLIETPHFSFLSSLAASCVAVFFLVYKLENLAIKLVEIALEKHKFPNFFFVKKRNFFNKKTLLFTV
jgi:hypothetical protein